MKGEDSSIQRNSSQSSDFLRQRTMSVQLQYLALITEDQEHYRKWFYQNLQNYLLKVKMYLALNHSQPYGVTQRYKYSLQFPFHRLSKIPKEIQHHTFYASDDLLSTYYVRVCSMTRALRAIKQKTNPVFINRDLNVHSYPVYLLITVKLQHLPSARQSTNMYTLK